MPSTPSPLPRLVTAIALTLVLVAAACADTATDEGSLPDLGDARPVVALERFDGCDSLLAHLKAEALERVGPFGLEGAYGQWGGPIMEDGDAFAAEGATRSDLAAAPATGGDEAGPAVSTTNNQYVGVDEADLVKADGDRMVVLTGNELTVLDLTGDRPEVVGSDLVPGDWGHELVVDGDRALVVSQGYREASGGPIPLDEPTVARDVAFSLGSDTVHLTEVDLADDGPRVVTTLTVDGTNVGTRLVDGTARVVVSTPGPRLGFVYPNGSGSDSERVAEEANRSVIEASAIEDWLPTWTLEGDAPAEGTLDRCDRVHRPADFSGFGVLSVHTVDLGRPLGEPEPVSVLADGETVTATAEDLYVATTAWTDPDAEPSSAEQPVPDGAVVAPWPEAPDTAVHAFTLTPDGADYAASGRVRGRVLDQFSMDEHGGVLRMATTDGAPWGDASSESFVTTLRQEGDRLVEVGRVGGLGKGEEIQAVRFMGDRGYVVTFRQVDPLYVVDLADPAAPAVEGELKILGFSAYLHPLDDEHLVGVGQDATEDGVTTGTQVSVFDVGDPTDPTRSAQHTLAGGYAEVEHDHRAFLLWEGTAFVPVARYDQGHHRTGLLALDVGPDSVTERALLEDLEIGQPRRSVVVGDRLHVLGESGLATYDLDGLDPVGQVAL